MELTKQDNKDTQDNQTDHILFKRLNPGAQIPVRGTPSSAGFDLFALADTVIDGATGSTLVHTGIAVALPRGTYGRIAMRSGLAVRQHLNVSAGVIDVDYRGELGVVVYCTKADHQYTIKAGERFAQLVPEYISYADSVVVDELPAPDQYHGGFGSTGAHMMGH